ncbi:MAG: hypothetical protein ABJB05_01880 [Parafilimonas sp.]
MQAKGTGFSNNGTTAVAIIHFKGVYESFIIPVSRIGGSESNTILLKNINKENILSDFIV